ncbi:MAG: SCO family protein [Planctomycetaceae bacterium]|jgi:protein SCO1/2|nr:MAG: SCO family protein [Planctomycetaceae bacterium]
MKTAFHVSAILLLGVLLGLSVRGLRQPATVTADGVAMYSNDAPLDPESVHEDEPAMAPEGWMTDFELTERSGESIGSDDLKGSPYVVSFFFSTCPSICVQQNQKVQELQREFAGTGVRFVSISVDPETDTPEVLQEYAARFGADAQQWLFMTGDLTYIRRVGGEVFRLAVDEKFHTEKFVLVHPSGSIIGYYSWPESKQFDKLKTDIRSLLTPAA